jgi:molybdate transport system substrate-binding protein
LLAAFAVVLVLVPAAGAGPGGLRVLAATSLATVLPKIDAHERYTFAGSSKLAARIEAGTHADVFVSTPVVFAHNTVVVIVPAKNAVHIRTLGDLRRHGVKVEIADATVALGGYTLQILKTLHLNGCSQTWSAATTTCARLSSRWWAGRSTRGSSTRATRKPLGAT